MSEQSWVHLDFQVIQQETEKAFKVVLEDGSIHWLPKSQVSDSDDYKAGDRNGTISISEWLANEKGIE